MAYQKTKRGTLSQKEKWFLDKYHDKQTPEQMAAKLRRPLVTVYKYLKQLEGGGSGEATQMGEPPAPSKFRSPTKEMQLGEELMTRPEWEHFKDQFTPKELDHFKYKYVQLMGQFRDDTITPTEEMQIYQLITQDILIQRTLKEQREVAETMERISKKINELYEEPGGDSQKTQDRIRTQEAAYARGGETIRGLTQRYESYVMRQSSVLKELKATRDQRVKILENSKQSFLGFLRLLNEEEQRISVGKEMELMRLATEAEAARLATPHVYDDGVTDQPLLTPDTVTDY